MGLCDERGTGLPEYAIILVVLMTFVFGIMDFSRFLYTYHFVDDAARSATRYAAVRGSTFASTQCNPPTTTYACWASATNITSYVQGTAPTGIASPHYPTWTTATPASCPVTTTVTTPTVNTCWPGTAPSGATGACTSTANGTTGVKDNIGCLVEVQVQYPFKFLLPFMPKSASTYTVSSTSEVVISQ